MVNNFCLCETCDTEFVFGALDIDQDCAGVPSLSQVSGLLIVPNSATLPSDWESRAAWEAVIDNDSTDNSFGKYLSGIGSVAEPEKTVVTVAKGVEITTIRDYVLEMEFYNLSATQYEFFSSLQCNPLNYKFWIENISGHLWGGANGISPQLTDVDFPLGAGEVDVEKAVLTIQWRSKCDPPRTYIEDLSENFPGGAETSNVLGFATNQVLGYSTTEIFGF
jgi:hypothetical protein